MLFPPLEMVNTAGPLSVPPAAVVSPPRTVIWPPVGNACFASELDLDRVARRDIRDREILDRVQNRFCLLLDPLGGDGVHLKARRVRAGRGTERDAEVERETGQDSLADGLALLVQRAHRKAVARR